MNLRCLFRHDWVQRGDDLWVCSRCHKVAKKVCVAYEMGMPFFEYMIVEAE